MGQEGNIWPRWLLFSLVASAIAAAVVVVAVAGEGDSTGGGEAASTEPDEELSVSTTGWETDFSTHSVPLSEFVGGGPGKDGIPSIDDPKFVSIDAADGFLGGREPVAVVELGGEVRAYPIQILTWHEIVNDELGGEAIAVTFCPLCNSTVAFKREVEGRTLEFGTTGNLRSSDLVMYDRTTESWWQQLTAEAIVGELTGTELEVIPSQILSWNDFKDLHPDGEVLSRDTGFSRPYGENPYVGYDNDQDSQPFLLDEEADGTLPPKQRVTAIRTGERAAVVYPFPRLAKEAPINDEIGGEEAVVFYDPDAASALDSLVLAQGEAVGSAAVFERAVGGRTLTFVAGSEPGSFRDEETGSEWSMAGEATAGELEGERLRQIASDDQFWFAIAAFFEDAEIRS